MIMQILRLCKYAESLDLAGTSLEICSFDSNISNNTNNNFYSNIII